MTAQSAICTRNLTTTSTREYEGQIFYSLKNIINNEQTLKSIFMAYKSSYTPELAWKINSDRFDIIISGSIVTHYSVSDGRHVQQKLNAGDVLYIPALAWSQPIWLHKVTVLSLICSHHKVGISLQKWNGDTFSIVEKKTFIRQDETVGNRLLQALSELCVKQRDKMTAILTIRSLVSHISTMSEVTVLPSSRQKTLFNRIIRYVDNHYTAPLSREILSEKFYISPNYISNLFQQQSNTSFKEYICNQRIMKAKNLLTQSDNRIKQISNLCGFTDNNYFCRLFKQKTGITPSQYRSSTNSIS